MLDDSGNMVKSCNFRTTTAKHLNSLNKEKQFEKLWDLMQHNTNALWDLLQRVQQLSKQMHMVRIGSDLCPMYTHANFDWFYKETSTQNYLSTQLKQCGEFAQKHHIRLSFHPGQYTILNSARDDVVIKSIEEIDYHTQMAVWMGYNEWHKQGFCINIHGGSGKQGLAYFKENLSILNESARNLLTVENDELSYSITDLLDAKLGIPIVVDLHHEWIKTGQYMWYNSDTMKRVMDTWNGVRPKIHVSMPKPELIDCANKTKLRSHSDLFYDEDFIHYCLEFVDNFDIMCEFKGKNLAAKQLFAHLNN